MSEAYRIINDLLAQHLCTPDRIDDCERAKRGDFSRLSTCEVAAIQYLHDNAVHGKTLIRASLYDIVFR